ncbi:hypothetical protein D9757_001813 [Collybiopsis confluens]|uniref:Acyl-CoA desaturase n=1 Tax=Collybiopsis confluens TaxID=2823264 RepID=A0A8H5MFA7_9AGAR|nr:hypothetical protein D9757_001813 [Collybiopsis confluens]
MGSANVSHPQIWWSNGLFFISVHIAAFIGIFWLPPSAVPHSTLILACANWQLAEFGITIGYHRLWSHSAFRARTGVRVVLAALGSAGFQGSIKRFTDDPVHDPYAATRGLLYSHMGWIFFKPAYTRLKSVEREDLDRDPIVRLQHRFYVPIALFFGFILPTLVGSLWHDPVGAFLYGGLVARLAIWHCTFLVNSLAHFHGIQPFSDEDTSRGNLLLAILTSGEGNHNFVGAYLPIMAKKRTQHAFPHDYRSSPWTAWDPSSAVILVLHQLGLATGLRQARDADLKEALAYMNHKSLYGVPPEEDDDERLSSDHLKNEGCQYWTIDAARLYVKERPGRCVVLLNGWVLDVTAYLGEHPGGASLLRKYALVPGSNETQWREASWAFDGGLNNHSRAARRRVKELRVARIRA